MVGFVGTIRETVASSVVLVTPPAVTFGVSRLRADGEDFSPTLLLLQLPFSAGLRVHHSDVSDGLGIVVGMGIIAATVPTLLPLAILGRWCRIHWTGLFHSSLREIAH